MHVVVAAAVMMIDNAAWLVMIRSNFALRAAGACRQ